MSNDRKTENKAGVRTLRQLSQRQASNCEQAREPVCRCRCGGALHGARRGDGDAFFNGLPDDDPHHIDSPEQKKAKKKAERDAAWKRRLDIYMRQPLG